jgi:WD40 repeat protein
VGSVGTSEKQRILPEHFISHGKNGAMLVRLNLGDVTRGLSFAPDERLLAAWGGHGLQVFDVSKGYGVVRSVSDNLTLCLAFSPDGKTYATGDATGRIAIWDTVSGKQIRSTVIHAPGAIRSTSL